MIKPASLTLGQAMIERGAADFIFTTNEAAKTWETIVLQADCAKNGLCSLSAVPIMTKWAKPEPENSSVNLLERLSSISYGVRIDPGGKIIAAPTANQQQK